MLRLASLSLVLFFAAAVWAQEAPPALSTGTGQDAFSQLMARTQGQPAPLLGTIQVNTYIAPSGAYKIPIPILQELGGNITDSEHLVTFEDNFLTHISIANFPLDATQRWELSTDGPKQYLIGFFERYVLRNYREAFKGADVKVEETGRYLPNMYGGSFIAFLLIPGGTNFNQRIPVLDTQAAPRVAKYGVLMFTRNGFVFIISLELAERSVEGSAYHDTPAHEDALLRGRLLDLASQMVFLSQAPPP